MTTKSKKSSTLVTETPKSIKKTYAEIIGFNNAAIQYLEDAKKAGTETKLSYVLHKALKKVEPHITDYNEKITEIRINHCSVNEKGVITKDSKGGLEFTKEAQLSVNKATLALGLVKVSIEPCLSPTAIEIVKKLPLDLRLVFAGFITPELEETED